MSLYVYFNLELIEVNECLTLYSLEFVDNTTVHIIHILGVANSL